MKENRPVVKGLLMVTQIGISMIVPIFLGAFIGYRFDKWFGTSFLFLIFLLFGILAAFRNIYKLTKPFYAEDLKRERKEQAYWESLRTERLPQETSDKKSAAAARRERVQTRKERDRQESLTQEKGSEQTAEELFAAWRREREKSHDTGDSDGSGDGEKDGQHGM